MESLISQTPFGGAIAAIVIIVLGVAAGLYMLDAYRSKKKKEDADAANNLIGILQKTVDELKDRVDDLEADLETATGEISKLKEKNGTLLEVLQGRDQQTQEFYKQAFEAMKISRETHTIVTDLAGSMKITNENMLKLIDLLGKHVDAIEHTATAAVGARRG